MRESRQEACAGTPVEGIFRAMRTPSGARSGSRGGIDVLPRDILCAACGSLFPAGDVSPGASVRCTLCGAVVEIAQVVVEKRPVRRTGDATFLEDAERRARPVPRERIRRALVVLAVVLALATVSAVVYACRDPIGAWVSDAWSSLRSAPSKPETTAPANRR